MNPFLSTYKTPFETIPFSKIKNEHYLPALKKGIEIAQSEIQQITSNPEKPSFENTI